MKRFCCILLLLSAFVQMARAVSPDVLWQKANAAYSQKQYDAAAVLYEQLAAQQPTATVYYNLGNACYRANRIGPAVLNYERALRLQPGFREAEDNLLLTQMRIGNRVQQTQDIFFVRWWHAWTSGNKADQWAVINIILLLFLLGAILTRRFRRPAWLYPQVIGGIAVLWLLCLVIAISAASNATKHDTAIIMQPDTPLTGGAGQAKSQSILPEGTKVSVLNKKSGWTEVKLGDGRTGWVQDAAVTVI